MRNIRYVLIMVRGSERGRGFDLEAWNEGHEQIRTLSGGRKIGIE